MRHVHPFPARMAPDLALASLQAIKAGVVLDPMTGSGTVARVAKEQSLTALGFDLDPLAVLISKVQTTPVDDNDVKAGGERLLSVAQSLHDSEIRLDWLDDDDDGKNFVDFWFAAEQRADLRKLAYLLSRPGDCELSSDVADILRIALSRIIVTKKSAASLAQDTSHSRPHKVATETTFSVFDGFEKSVRAVRRRVQDIPRQGRVEIRRGDARNLAEVSDESVDAVLTSPPYLNAIDYMRGHRMSLIWLGHRFADLRHTRSESIGSERMAKQVLDAPHLIAMKVAMGNLAGLSARLNGMVDRYVMDMYQMMSEVSRVLRPGRTATFVMGNSCLRGIYIENSGALAAAGDALGLKCIGNYRRPLPSTSRYLPTPAAGSLSKRMREEVILSFAKR